MPENCGLEPPICATEHKDTTHAVSDPAQIVEHPGNSELRSFIGRRTYGLSGIGTEVEGVEGVDRITVGPSRHGLRRGEERKMGVDEMYEAKISIIRFGTGTESSCQRTSGGTRENVRKNLRL